MAVINTGVPNITANEVWRDTQLDVSALSVLTDADAVLKINSDILPNVVSMVRSKLQHASIPFGYPFDEDLLIQAYSTLSDDSLLTIVTGWDVSYQECIKYFAMADVFLISDSLNEAYQKKALSLRKVGQEYIDLLVESIRATLKMLPSNTANRKLGLVKIKLPKRHYNPAWRHEHYWDL